MANIRNLDCCGVKEISGLAGLKSPEDGLKSIVENKTINYIKDIPFMVFTHAGSRPEPGPKSYGEKLRRFIERNDLGEVTRSTPKRNPNSGNIVTIYTWTINWENLNEFGKARNWDLSYQSGGSPETRHRYGRGNW